MEIKLHDKYFKPFIESQELDFAIANMAKQIEDDFQDERPDKYVYLDRSYKMNCQFNFKFKKWMPISVVDEEAQVVMEYELTNKSKI